LNKTTVETSALSNVEFTPPPPHFQLVSKLTKLIAIALVAFFLAGCGSSGGGGNGAKENEEEPPYVRPCDGVTTLAAGDDCGTEGNPIEISSATALAKIGVDSAFPNTAYYKLTADINLGNSQWTPIGTSTNPFKGTLDGNGKRVTGLYLGGADRACIGLFGATKSALIKNVSVEVANINTLTLNVSGASVGAIVGCPSETTTISGISVSALNGISVSSSSNVYVGGISGRSPNTSVENSRSSADIAITAYSGSSSAAGGLVASEGTITGSFATGDVSGGNYAGGLIGQTSGSVSDSNATGNVSGGNYAGGLIGQTDGSVANSYATGNVNGSKAGGLIGHVYNSGCTITNSYATGDVTAGGTNSYAGGLIGYVYSGSSPITNSYATGNVTASSSNSNSFANAGGLIGYVYSGSSPITNSYATGNVSASNISDRAWAGGLIGLAQEVGVSVQNSVAKNQSVSVDSGYNAYLIGWGVESSSNNFALDDLITALGAESESGVTSKTLEELQTQTTYSDAIASGGLGWDFVNVWYWDGVAQEPKLR
jgi:hypothetical protein